MLLESSCLWRCFFTLSTQDWIQPWSKVVRLQEELVVEFGNIVSGVHVVMVLKAEMQDWEGCEELLRPDTM